MKLDGGPGALLPADNGLQELHAEALALMDVLAEAGAPTGAMHVGENCSSTERTSLAGSHSSTGCAYGAGQAAQGANELFSATALLVV